MRVRFLRMGGSCTEVIGSYWPVLFIDRPASGRGAEAEGTASALVSQATVVGRAGAIERAPADVGAPRCLAGHTSGTKLKSSVSFA
jgi:hypothetical protein